MLCNQLGILEFSPKMPFKLRLKKKQYNVVTKAVFVICVELLDNSIVECTLCADSLGYDCLDNVCQRLGLNQVCVDFFPTSTLHY